MTAATCATERHYTVKELAVTWKLSPSTVTRIFRDEPGVLKIGLEHARRGHRGYVTLRIPESVVQRVYRRMVVR